MDVGGGIGSTSMLLAHAYSRSDGPPYDDDIGLKFVIQDREVVVEMGEKAWNAKCPELIESGIAQFQGVYCLFTVLAQFLTIFLLSSVHDFFTPQPIKNAAVFLLRVVLHDWPDAFAERILLRLREAAAPATKLLIADFVLPLACADDFGSLQDENEIQGVQGTDTKLAPPPLLPNLGKASANGYWMDMTVSPLTYALFLKSAHLFCAVDAGHVQWPRAYSSRNRFPCPLRWMEGHEGHKSSWVPFRTHYC